MKRIINVSCHTGGQGALRIVSLVPSLTETLHYLGLGDEVVGITKFCVHPQEWFRKKTRIGGTKNPDLERIASLQPTLVIANREENRKEDVEWLQQSFPVLLTDISTIAEAIKSLALLSTHVGRDESGRTLAANLAATFDQPLTQKISVAYFIWKDPWMTVGGDTFINDMLRWAGFENVFGCSIRYPITTVEETAALQPQCIFLSSEPFPFQEKHMAAWKAALPHAQIKLADGEMFSWYGSRMLLAAPYLQRLQAEAAAYF